MPLATPIEVAMSLAMPVEVAMSLSTPIENTIFGKHADSSGFRNARRWSFYYITWDTECLLILYKLADPLLLRRESVT